MAEPRAGGPDLNPGRPPRPSWDEYSDRWAALHLGLDPRRASLFVRTWLRLGYGAGRMCAMAGLSAMAVTTVGIVLSLGVPVLALGGGLWLLAAAGLVVLGAIADSADGATAVITSRTTRLGALYDSVADRISELAWLLALWLAGVPGILAAVCGALSFLHEYVRARATAVGLPVDRVITVAERPTRVLVTVIALTVGGVVALFNSRLAAGATTIVVAFWVLFGALGTARLLAAVRPGG